MIREKIKLSLGSVLLTGTFIAGALVGASSHKPEPQELYHKTTVDRVYIENGILYRDQKVEEHKILGKVKPSAYHRNKGVIDHKDKFGNYEHGVWIHPQWSLQASYR